VSFLLDGVISVCLLSLLGYLYEVKLKAPPTLIFCYKLHYYVSVNVTSMAASFVSALVERGADRINKPQRFLTIFSFRVVLPAAVQRCECEGIKSFLKNIFL